MGISIANVEGLISCPCCGECQFQPRLVIALEKLAKRWRERQGKNLYLTSGYRCPKHNVEVGGAKNSRHLLGQAVDCAVKKIDQPDFISLAKQFGFNGVGIGETYIHIDVRAIPCEPWHYTKPRGTK